MFFEREKIVQTIRERFHARPMLVIGDLMLDRYLWGEVNRISPEAPVPVIRIQRQTEVPGGAGNVALNLAELGFKVSVAGIIGEDEHGRKLCELFERARIEFKPCVATATRTTTTKTRIIGGHQQMLRCDREETARLPDELRQKLLQNVLQVIIETAPAAVILSDYDKGVLDELFCRKIIDTARMHGLPVLADPKTRDLSKFAGATWLSPNRNELMLSTGCEIKANDRLPELYRAGQALAAKLGLEGIVLTLSEAGIAYLEPGNVRHFPALAREVYDVSGAGDTVLAMIAAGRISGLCLEDTMKLANLAAGIVVGKVGTVAVGADELLSAIETGEALEQSGKICDLQTLQRRVEVWRSRSETIVFTNGCFDLLHAGHVTYLERARRQGDRLIVAVNTDRSVRALKGPSRPQIPEGDRARVLAALAAVDAVILFDEDTPLELIRALKPDVLAKGADYTEAQVVGAADVKSWGGHIALIEFLEGRSSSKIIEQVGRKRG